jgi:cytidine deaminase
MDVNAEPLRSVLLSAREARDNAYAPYSKFKMGAAILTESGEIVCGSLVENISLGLAMCSERVAFFSAVSSCSARPKILALHAPKTGGRLTWPCGACLQVAREFAGPDLIIVATDGVDVGTATLGELGPHLPSKT